MSGWKPMYSAAQVLLKSWVERPSLPASQAAGSGSLCPATYRIQSTNFC